MSSEPARCGVLANVGTVARIRLEGCGECVYEGAHAVRWPGDREAVVYHPRCCPLPHPHPAYADRPTPFVVPARSGAVSAYPNYERRHA